MTIRILVCCDSPLMCAGLHALLDQQPDLTAVALTTGKDALDAVHRWSPDLVLVISPALTIEHESELTALAVSAKVVLVTKAENTHRSMDALRIGVHAALPPDSSPDALVQVIRTVAGGDALVVPAAARPFFARPARTCSPLTARTAQSLTPREQEVLLLLTQGRSNEQIAAKFSISTATVRSHVHHLLKKLGVASRAQAVAHAYETGLIDQVEQRGGRR